MYTLGSAARSVVNLAFGLIGVCMAHAFYRSSRKRWLTVLIWLAAFTYCGVAAELVTRWNWFPQSTHEHISNIVGFGAVFAYLFLFTEVPVMQRVFTYFFIDNSMYILVLLARLLSFWTKRMLPFAQDLLFTLFFFLLAGCFLLFFFKKLRWVILRGLSAFHNELPILTAYACLSYIAMLVLVDAWGPMPMPRARTAFTYLLFCTASVCGYVLVFYALYAIRTAQDAARTVEQRDMQMLLSRQYYDALVESIEQDRLLRHDFTHHLRALEGMWAQGDTERLGAYLASLIQHGEEAMPARYCACYVANVLLDYFRRQAGQRGIALTIDAVIPERGDALDSHLSVVLGNLLQNAFEACERLDEERKRRISLLARVVGDNLTLEVENSFDGVVREEDGRLLSRKAESGHGMGLNSVERAASACGGFFSFTHGEGVFRARVVLRLPPEEPEEAGGLA